MLVSSLYSPHHVGGAELVAQELAEGLVADGDQCTVATLGNGKLEETKEINGVRVHYLPLANLYWPFDGQTNGGVQKALWHGFDSYNASMGSALSGVIEKENPDVVNTHTLTGFSVTAWRAAKRHDKPLVHTLHDQYLLCPRCSMFKDGCNCAQQCRDCRIYSAPRKFLSDLPDVVTGVSRFVLDRHKAHGVFENTKQEVIYNAVELTPASKSIEHASRVRFGFLGRLHPTKGIERFLDAFLGFEKDQAELWIGGRGKTEYESALKDKTAHRSDIRWLGFVEPAQFLPQLDVLVVPSLWHEPAGRVVQEAFACGVPVIAASRGGIPEMVTDDAGWLFDPDQPGALEARLEAAAAEPASLRRMEAAVRSLAQTYNLKRMIDGYRGAYQSAIALSH